MSRRAALAIVLLVLALGAYSAYWHWMAGRLEAGIEQWAEGRKSLGARVHMDWSGVRGFPLAFESEFRAPAIEADLGDGWSLVWSAPRLKARMDPWNIRRFYFAIDGRQEFWLGDARQNLGYALESDQPLMLELGLHGNGALAEAAIVAGHARLSAGDQAAIGAAMASASVSLPENLPADFRAALASLSLSIDDLILPDQSATPLGTEIEHLGMNLDIMGPLAPANPIEALAKWRDGGGTVEFRRFDFRQKGFAVVGDATLALDEDLQLMGAGRMEVVGMPLLLDRLAESKLIEPGAAILAKATVKALERPNAQGELAASLGISLQGGVVRLGPVVLGRLPRIHWQ